MAPHQLHCLQMFRNDMRELMARIDGRSDGKDHTLYEFDSVHTLHCLDYLRQVRVMYRFTPDLNRSLSS